MQEMPDPGYGGSKGVFSHASGDPEIKADEALYEERLAVCKECDLLLEGMCRICGCYVELRAAIEKNACPWKKW